MAERPTLNRQSSATSQPQSIDERSSFRLSNPDIFSDDFALEPLEVADGYNSSAAAGRSQEVPQPCRTPDPGSSPIHTTDASSKTPTRSKGPHRLERGGSFTLRHENPHSRIHQRPVSGLSVSEVSDLASQPQRSLSTSTTFTIPRTQSPAQVATGPSHPYGMYPQDVGMTRTPSVATNSTMGIHARHSGPAHPYGMYPQNTVPEGVDSAYIVTNPSIPVGFPGLGQRYQRRLGPEGEEVADIIGPDGHTEQLPPYTQYPVGFAPKPTPPAPTSMVNPAHVAPHPVPAASDVSSSPLSATRSHASEASGAELNNFESPPVTQSENSGNFKERWTEKSKRRTCGGKLPLWLVVVAVFLLVLAGALVGGIIGRIVGRRRAQENEYPAPAQNWQPTVYVSHACVSFLER